MKRNLTKMETVLPTARAYGDSYSLTLGGGDRNTVRLSKPKYAFLPGDYVEMLYVTEPGGEPIAVEWLRVRAVAHARNLEDLLDAHAQWNHGVFHLASPRSDLWEILTKFYPEAFNEDGSDDVEGVSWLAIYFE